MGDGSVVALELPYFSGIVRDYDRIHVGIVRVVARPIPFQADAGPKEVVREHTGYAQVLYWLRF